MARTAYADASTSYAMYPHALQGGLNNMVSNLGQLVHDACTHSNGDGRSNTFVLPRFTTGGNFFRRRGEFDDKSLPFGDVFDPTYFAARLGLDCKVVERLPTGAGSPDGFGVSGCDEEEMSSCRTRYIHVYLYMYMYMERESFGH